MLHYLRMKVMWGNQRIETLRCAMKVKLVYVALLENNSHPAH